MLKVSTRPKLSRVNVIVTVLLLLGPAGRVLSSPTGFDGDVFPPFEVSEREVQNEDTLCPLVELPQAFNGQVQAYSIWPENENIDIAERNVIRTPCLQNSVGLDRDIRASYSFILTARASDGSGRDSINITLHLLDDNDNSPSFHRNTTTASFTIPENAAVHDSVGPGPILAEDPDEGVNGTVQYRLEGCNDVFQINNSTGLITLKASSLDRERKNSYTCMVNASDLAVHNPRSASFEFDIGVGDVNDNAPHCFNGQDSISFNMTENATIGKLFQCKDADLGINGTVSETVTLANASLSNNISVTYRNTGVFSGYALSVKGLDREHLGSGENRYFIQLYVTDQGTPPQTSTLNVTIFVEDVNDSPPKFQGPSSLYVSEDHAADQPIGRVYFTDNDLHSELTYSLRQSMRGKEDIRLSANISVTNNGDIFVYNPIYLDFESPLPPEIVLTVEVTDGVHMTTGNVTLRIIDVNDNSPVFESSAYSFSIEENVALGTHVGTVTARDADSGNYSAIRYTIQTMGTPFVISESSGEITTSGPIDREKVASYSIKVMAEDRSTMHRQNVTKVTITVLDKDDNCPVFPRKEYTVSWYENEVQVPITVRANDDDSDAFNKVRYSLDVVIQFEIDENSGNVSLRGSELPDENTTLTVMAEANVEGGSPNCSVVTAKLVIIFYSGHRPSTPPPTSAGTLPIIISVCSVSGVLVLCIVVMVCFAVIAGCMCKRHSKEYNINNFSPAESPSEKETVARTKSILKSYNSEGANGKQKNSVRFVEIIEKGNIHFFEPETPLSSPDVANGCPPQQQPSGSHSLQLSIDSSSCEDDLLPFPPSIYSDHNHPISTMEHINDGYEMELRLQNYRPPTPPLSHRSLEERIPLQDIPFTTRQSESSALPHNGYYTPHQERQLPWSTSYHPSAHRNGVGLTQRRSGASFLSGSGTSLASDDRDSLSASLDNYSTYTEQGTDVMSQVPGPMENLFSNLQQSSMLQRCVRTCSCVCMCVFLEVGMWVC